MIKNIKKGYPHMKKILMLLLLCVSTPALAQEAYWGFDDSDKVLSIPPECDETTNPKELYEIGMRLLDETGYVQNSASYCLMASAVQGYPLAQYQTAYLYYKGLTLPKSDLAAYKWATLAALAGNEDADRLAANIEQFLSVDDIVAATDGVSSMLDSIKKHAQDTLVEENARYDELFETIKTLRQEISDLKRYGRIIERPKENVAAGKQSSSVETSKNKSKVAADGQRATKNQAIFSQKDIKNAPLPKVL